MVSNAISELIELIELICVIGVVAIICILIGSWIKDCIDQYRYEHRGEKHDSLKIDL